MLSPFVPLALMRKVSNLMFFAVFRKTSFALCPCAPAAQKMDTLGFCVTKPESWEKKLPVSTCPLI